jgi:hypothetical protein
MKNKRAISTVVTTIIIIALSLVAIGIAWGFIQNLIQDSASDIDIESRCLKAGLEITAADDSSVTVKNIGTIEIQKVEVTLSNSTDSEQEETTTKLKPQAVETISVDTVTDATDASAVVIFDGTYCRSATTYEIAQTP